MVTIGENIFFGFIILIMFFWGMLLGLSIANNDIVSKEPTLKPYKTIVENSDTTYYFKELK